MNFNGKTYNTAYFNGKRYTKAYFNGKQVFGNSYHPLTVRILARATAIGATPPTNLANFDSYIRSMADVLTNYCDIFFRFRGTGDTNFKRINLANPEGALAGFFGGYALDNSGFKGNGINAYIDTNFNPGLLIAGQKYQLNDAGKGVVISEYILGQAISSQGNGYDYWFTNNSTTFRFNSLFNIPTAPLDFRELGLKVISKVNDNLQGINKDVTQNSSIGTVSIRSEKVRILMSNNTTYSNLKVSSFFMGKSIPFNVSQLIRAAENADMANLGLLQIA